MGHIHCKRIIIYIVDAFSLTLVVPGVQKHAQIFQVENSGNFPPFSAFFRLFPLSATCEKAAASFACRRSIEMFPLQNYLPPQKYFPPQRYLPPQKYLPLQKYFPPRKYFPPQRYFPLFVEIFSFFLSQGIVLCLDDHKAKCYNSYIRKIPPNSAIMYQKLMCLSRKVGPHPFV